MARFCGDVSCSLRCSRPLLDLQVWHDARRRGDTCAERDKAARVVDQLFAARNAFRDRKLTVAQFAGRVVEIERLARDVD